MSEYTDKLFMEALLAIVDEKGHATLEDILMVKEAVASTAIEHPEWPEDDDGTE